MVKFHFSVISLQSKILIVFLIYTLTLSCYGLSINFNSEFTHTLYLIIYIKQYQRINGYYNEIQYIEFMNVHK